jgi:hypothetical protein
MCCYFLSCFLSGDRGDSYCEESTEEAQISVLFLLLVLYVWLLPVSIIGDLFRMDVLVRLPVLVCLLDEFVYDID